MKQTLLIILILTLYLSLSAQITVSNASLPAAGDTLRTAVFNLPNGFTVSPAGTDQSWDFSEVEVPFMREQVIRPASEGENMDQYPDATSFINLVEVSETYYKTSESKYEILGFIGEDPAGFGVQLATKFDPPIIDRRAPLNYPDVNLSESEVLQPIAWADLPTFITDSLGLEFTPDSIRLRVESNFTDQVDAWGSLTIPGGTYEVLREKKIELRESFLDAKLGIGDFAFWQDVTPFVNGLIPFFGKDTIIIYRFFDETSKEPIATLNVDDSGENITRIEYKVNDFISNVRTINSSKTDVYAYPNPAIEDVRFEFTNLPTGSYTLKIFNILGVAVYEQPYHRLSGNYTEKVDLSKLLKGTYLYSLVNAKGKAITTKRLMIIRP